MRVGTSYELRKIFAIMSAAVAIPTITACLWLAWYTYTHPETQAARECRPYPGYCDIDTDWQPPVSK